VNIPGLAKSIEYLLVLPMRGFVLAIKSTSQLKVPCFISGFFFSRHESSIHAERRSRHTREKRKKRTLDAGHFWKESGRRSTTQLVTCLGMDIFTEKD
jgi:hypothetical protein